MPVGDRITSCLAEGAAYRGYLEAMRQAIVYEHGAGQGEYLRLVLQAPKRGGKNDAVVIADIGSADGIGIGIFMRAVAAAPRIVKGLPVHEGAKVAKGG